MHPIARAFEAFLNQKFIKIEEEGLPVTHMEAVEVARGFSDISGIRVDDPEQVAATLIQLVAEGHELVVVSDFVATDADSIPVYRFIRGD